MKRRLTGAIGGLGRAERWNGSRWALAGEFRVGAHASLTSVSCSSAGPCTAVGGHVVKTTFLPLAACQAAGSVESPTFRVQTLVERR